MNTTSIHNNTDTNSLFQTIQKTTNNKPLKLYNRIGNEKMIEATVECEHYYLVYLFVCQTLNRKVMI